MQPETPVRESKPDRDKDSFLPPLQRFPSIPKFDKKQDKDKRKAEKPPTPESGSPKDGSTEGPPKEKETVLRKARIDNQRWVKWGVPTRTDFTADEATTAAKNSPTGLFTDPNFPPDTNSLGKEVSRQFQNSLITWKRPKEFLKNPQMFIDGASSGDVRCGKLSTGWFLGALSVIANRDDLLKALLVSEHPEYGFYQFKFFKNNVWWHITIDDYLPLVTTNNGLEFVSAHGDNPDEIWVPLVEKAYAKLIGTYSGLLSGWQAEAFVDLTGGVAERVEITREIEQDELKLWGFMKYCSDERWLIGCSAGPSKQPPPQQASTEDTGSHGSHSGSGTSPMKSLDAAPPRVAASMERSDTLRKTDPKNKNPMPGPTGPPETKSRGSEPKPLQRQKTTLSVNGSPKPGRVTTKEDFRDVGLLRGLSYAIICLFEYYEKSGTLYRLIQLKNPWGTREWSGPWCDSDEQMWTSHARKTAQTRFGYNFDFNDGFFWMEYTDFKKYFTRLNVCRLYDDSYGEQYVRQSHFGGWKDATGGGAKTHPTWNQNPQYSITVEKKCNICISLTQEDMGFGGKKQTPYLPIAFHVFFCADNTRRKVEPNLNKIASTKVYHARHEVIYESDFLTGKYIIVPSAIDPGQERNFILVVYSQEKGNVVVKPLPDYDPLAKPTLIRNMSNASNEVLLKQPSTGQTDSPRKKKAAGMVNKILMKAESKRGSSVINQDQTSVQSLSDSMTKTPADQTCTITIIPEDGPISPSLNDSRDRASSSQRPLISEPTRQTRSIENSGKKSQSMTDSGKHKSMTDSGYKLKKMLEDDANTSKSESEKRQKRRSKPAQK